jgi:hypothetical protein
MKLFLIALAVLAFIAATPRAQALFGHVAAEKERRQAAEAHLVQEQQTNGQLIDKNQRLHAVISILSGGVAVALIIGAAAGSKTRRDATRP